MSEAILTLAGVHTHIGEYHILQGVDMQVPRGGLSVLLGRNGAGDHDPAYHHGLVESQPGQDTF